MSETQLPTAQQAPFAVPNAGSNTGSSPVAEPQHELINYVKWGLGCAGVSMILITGFIMFAMIVTPVVFRNLLPEQQEIWMHRLPFLHAFKPTRVFQGNTLPTASVSDDSAALALLGNQNGTSVALVSSPTAPVSATPTLGTPRPTSVLATNTPVIATALPTQPIAITSTVAPTATFQFPTLAPTDMPIASSAFVTGIKFVQQAWNNCGPANITQVLRKYGWTGKQEDAAEYLKPFREDKNVSPWQMVNFVNLNSDKWNLRALFRIGGNLKLLKALVSADFGVIIEKGHVIPDQGWMGHYLTVEGYDDAAQILYGMDTNLGPGADGRGRPFAYDELDTRWRQFNRVFIVVYPTEREAELAAVLGNYRDESWAIHAALNTAKVEASSYPNNPYAWFNLGSSFAMLQDYQNAAIAFDKARTIGTEWRMLWYQFGPYEAYYNVGRYGDVLALADATLNSTSRGLGLEESHYWRGMTYAAQGKLKESENEFGVAIEWNPNYYPAKEQLTLVESGSFKPPVTGQ